ncbi:hypothetical protein, partial [Gluconacetobacter dulcium]|uniref:hypothetical protein n=1 Tax=Gluconacetobacter dulcium TaxID=2729096 RepID=UPI001C81E1DF
AERQSDKHDRAQKTVHVSVLFRESYRIYASRARKANWATGVTGAYAKAFRTGKFRTGQHP